MTFQGQKTSQQVQQATSLTKKSKVMLRPSKSFQGQGDKDYLSLKSNVMDICAINDIKRSSMVTEL